MNQHVTIHHSSGQSRCRVIYVRHKRQLKVLNELKDGDIAIVAPDRKCITRSYLFQDEKWILMDEKDIRGQ